MLSSGRWARRLGFVAPAVMLSTFSLVIFVYWQVGVPLVVGAVLTFGMNRLTRERPRGRGYGADNRSGTSGELESVHCEDGFEVRVEKSRARCVIQDGEYVLDIAIREGRLEFGTAPGGTNPNVLIRVETLRKILQKLADIRGGVGVIEALREAGREAGKSFAGGLLVQEETATEPAPRPVGPAEALPADSGGSADLKKKIVKKIENWLELDKRTRFAVFEERQDWLERIMVYNGSPQPRGLEFKLTLSFIDARTNGHADDGHRGETTLKPIQIQCAFFEGYIESVLRSIFKGSDTKEPEIKVKATCCQHTGNHESVSRFRAYVEEHGS